MKSQKKEFRFVLQFRFVCIVDKKNYPQVYLEHCKYKIRIRKLVDFIDDEVDLSSDDSDYLDEQLQIIDLQ